MARGADHPINTAFIRRWSGRAMSGAPVSRGELMRLFEAARFAPSSGNAQPWRFVFAVRDTPGFAELFQCLDDGNRAWCVRAGALIVICAQTVLDSGKPNRYALFDAGAAWMALALQGTAQGLVVHALGGFDGDRLRAVVHPPEGIEIIAVVAVGLPGNAADLSARDQSREQPNDRRPQGAFVIENRFAP